MRCVAAWIVLAGCGRIAFDAQPGDGGTGDTPSDALGAFIKTYPGAGSQSGMKVAVAPDGGVGMAAIFDSSVALESGPLTSRGSFDSAILQLGADAGLEWAVHIGGVGWDQIRGIAYDAAGNVYVTGQFEATVDFGGGPLVAAGEEDIFIASYDSGGGYRWAQRFGAGASGTAFGSDQGLALAVSPGGDVYVGGQYRGVVDFGGIILDSMGFEFFAFVLALDASGSSRWATSIGTTAANRVSSLAADASGVVATGYMQGTVDFGGGGRTSNGLQDMFVASYDRDGGHRFSATRGGNGIDWGHAVAVDDAGNAIVAGTYQQTVDLGAGVIAQTTAAANSFILQFDAAGSQRWAYAVDAPCSKVLGVAVGPGGTIFAVGNFNGSIDLGSASTTSGGPGDAFIATLDRDGAVRALGSVTSAGYDLARGVAVSPAGGLYVTGHTNGADDCPSYAATLSAAEDLFLAYFPLAP